jgi:U3 small nucleolar RNA-associated protein 24
MQVKRIIGQRDARLKKNQEKGEIENKKKSTGNEVVREMYVLSWRTPLSTSTNSVPDLKFPPPSSSSTIPPSSHPIPS